MPAAADHARRVAWGRWLLGSCAIGLAYITIQAAEYLRYQQPHKRDMAIAGLIGLAVLAVGRTRLFTEEGRYRRTLALLLAGVVGTGILLVAFVPTIPFSDFASYLKLACRFATGEPLPPAENARFFQAWGYPVALAPGQLHLILTPT